MRLITRQQMQWLDQTAILKREIPSLSLMENAGREVVKIILERYFPHLAPPINPSNFSYCKKSPFEKHASNLTVSLFCGRGNNGGDGFVIARYLWEIGFKVRVYLLAQAEEYHEDALINLHRLPCSFSLLLNNNDLKLYKREIENSSLIVDAIFGTGLDRPIQGFTAQLIRFLNQTEIPIVAVDIPSGLCVTTGNILGEAIFASTTVTFHLPKRGLVLGPAIDRVGELKVVKIGIPEDLTSSLPDRKNKEFLITPDLFNFFFKPREKQSHKNKYGHVLTIAGSKRKLGAALMTSRAALRSGAGLSTLVLPECAYEKINRKFSEVMFEPQVSDGDFFSFSSLKMILKLIKNKSVVACGPGMGVSEDLKKMIHELISRVKVPLVLDADALNCIALSQKPFPKKHSFLVLTPHPGEFERLVPHSKNLSLVQREKSAIEFAKKHKIYLVLKGYRSWVTTPKGELYVNPTGNPGMATAGAGDVLTGIIAGLIAQKIPLQEAVLAAVWIHGRAGDLVAEEKGERGIVAWDIAEKVPFVLKEISR